MTKTQHHLSNNKLGEHVEIKVVNLVLYRPGMTGNFRTDTYSDTEMPLFCVELNTGLTGLIRSYRTETKKSELSDLKVTLPPQ